MGICKYVLSYMYNVCPTEHVGPQILLLKLLPPLVQIILLKYIIIQFRDAANNSLGVTESVKILNE